MLIYFDKYLNAVQCQDTLVRDNMSKGRIVQEPERPRLFIWGLIFQGHTVLASEKHCPHSQAVRGSIFYITYRNKCFQNLQEHLQWKILTKLKAIKHMTDPYLCEEKNIFRDTILCSQTTLPA